MHKFWLVAKQEYRNRTFKRSFVLGTLVLPFLMLILLAAIIIITIVSLDDRPLGYVDHSGALAGASMPADSSDFFVEIVAFPDEASAHAALEAEEIQGYHVIPEDYLDTLYVDLYYLEEAPDTNILRDFDDYVRANILENAPTRIQTRIIEGTTLTVQAMNDSREFQDNEMGIFVIMLPLMIAMFFLFAINILSGKIRCLN